MSYSLALSLWTRLSGSLTKGAGVETATVPINETISIPISEGTAANQADIFFSETRTLAISGNHTYNLSSLVEATLGDSGSPQATLHIKAIIIQSAPLATDGTNDLTVGGGSNPLPELANSHAVKAGGLLQIIDPNVGYVVTPSTGMNLLVANAAGSTQTFNIWIIGTSV
jgi:hypothetical protein